ncbi:hypothetical protein [Nocardia nova]|uniref:hypothetical protein n=1 Tax=Nocardia nova TaxID=37330 RepID=UPI0011B0B487|nr:hypothetical protein [Nocardia nova]
MTAPFFNEEYVRLTKELTPLGEVGKPEYIADGIVNVLRSDWITGQAIVVDGGAGLVTARGSKRDIDSISPK